jgi:hypothetical protein
MPVRTPPAHLTPDRAAQLTVPPLPSHGWQRRRSTGGLTVKRLILSAILAFPAATAGAMSPADLEAYLRAASPPERQVIQTFIVSCGTSLKHLEQNDADGAIPGNKVCNQALARWEAAYHVTENTASDDVSDLLQEINADVDPLAIGRAYSLLIPLSRALQATRAATAAGQPKSP